MVGITQPLKQEPRNVLPDNHSKPSSQQMVGATVSLQSQPSTVKFGAGTPNGTLQMVGEQVKMNSKPQSGWTSFDTPPSERTIAQKKNF